MPALIIVKEVLREPLLQFNLHGGSNRCDNSWLALYSASKGLLSWQIEPPCLLNFQDRSHEIVVKQSCLLNLHGGSHETAVRILSVPKLTAVSNCHEIFFHSS